MKLTAEQQEKAIALRGLLNSTAPENGWEHYLDFTRAIAQMIDGLDSFVRPTEMKSTFDRAWKSFCKVWQTENERVILEAIGGDQVLLDQVRGHPNGVQIQRRILDRVVQRNGGTAGIGIEVGDVDVTDILSEGMNGSEFD